MYRAIPIGNKLLDDKWVKKQLMQHKLRVKLMKPTFRTYDSKPRLSSNSRNLKRDQYFEGNNFITAKIVAQKSIERIKFC